MTPAQQALFDKNKGIAVWTLKKFWGMPCVHLNHATWEDAVQAAMLALWQCALGFRDDGGARFSTYAYYGIRNELMRCDGALFKCSQHYHRKVETAGGQTPRVRLKGGEWDPAVESDAAERTANQELAASVQQALSHLDARSARVIRLRHGLDGPVLTLTKVGGILGVTKERVRQIQIEAEAKLRRLLERKAVCA